MFGGSFLIMVKFMNGRVIFWQYILEGYISRERSWMYIQYLQFFAGCMLHCFRLPTSRECKLEKWLFTLMNWPSTTGNDTMLTYIKNTMRLLGIPWGPRRLSTFRRYPPPSLGKFSSEKSASSSGVTTSWPPKFWVKLLKVSSAICRLCDLGAKHQFSFSSLVAFPTVTHAPFGED